MLEYLEGETAGALPMGLSSRQTDTCRDSFILYISPGEKEPGKSNILGTEEGHRKERNPAEEPHLTEVA